MENNQEFEELKRALDNQGGIKLSLLLHPNIFIHLLLIFFINTLVILGILGIFNFAYYTNVKSIIVLSFIFTFLEFIIKLITVRFMLGFVVKSFGIIFIIETLMLFTLLDPLLGSKFIFHNYSSVIFFSLIFTFVRVAITSWVSTKIRDRYLNNLFKGIK